MKHLIRKNENEISLYLSPSLFICVTFVSFVHFPTDTFSSVSHNLSLSPVISLPLYLLPPSPLTVKVTLIKSSRRTELLIAPRRSSWFQIQIKARRLFFFLLQAPLPLHLCSTMLNTIWVLAVWTVITWPRPPLPLRTEGQDEGESEYFSSLWSQVDFQLAQGHTHTHKLYLFRNVQPVILGSDKWGVHEVCSFYKYLCVCMCVSLCLSPVFRTDSSLQAGKSLTAL